MTRAASFFAGVTLLGVVAVSIGIGLLHSTLPDGGWSQIAYGAFFIGVGVIRLAAVLRAARTSRAEETPRRKSTTSSRSSSKSSAEFHSPPRHGAPPHSTTICRGEYLLAAATIHSIPTLNNESTNTRSGPTAGSLAPQKIQSTSKFSLSNEPSTLLICRCAPNHGFDVAAHGRRAVQGCRRQLRSLRIYSHGIKKHSRARKSSSQDRGSVRTLIITLLLRDGVSVAQR